MAIHRTERCVQAEWCSSLGCVQRSGGGRGWVISLQVLAWSQDVLRAAAAEILLLQCANGWRREVALTHAWSGWCENLGANPLTRR